MMRSVIAIAMCCALSGCMGASKAADAIARDQAKSVVNGVVEAQAPGVNVAPVTDCIIDAASAGEILTIARASVTGVDNNTVNLVLDISKRPDAVKCIAKNGLSLLGG